MKAINLDGQKIIDEAIRVRKNNKLLIIDKIRSAIRFIKHKGIDSALNDVFDAYEVNVNLIRIYKTSAGWCLSINEAQHSFYEDLSLEC